MKMKKTNIAAAVLAGVMAFSGIPGAAAPLVTEISAASKLSAPAGIKATVTDTAVKLSWSKVSGADAYRVYKYNATTKKYETYKNVSAASCTVSGLSAGKTYKFKVAALVKSGSGYTVQTQSAAQSVKTKLAAPKNVKASAGASSVKLTWNKVTGADAYRIYKYNSSSKKYETYKNVSGTSCTVSGLSAGTYRFKVAALVESGSKYTAQAQSAEAKATVSSSKSSGASLMSFPSFGTSKSSAVKAMGLTGGVDLGEMQAGVYAYGGYKKVNGTDCMVILYFNSSQKFFYGAAFIPTEAITFKKALSSLRSAYGDETVKLNSSGIEMYEWVDETAMTAEFIGGKSGGEMTLYGKISSKYAPAGMSNSSDPMSSLGDIGSIL